MRNFNEIIDCFKQHLEQDKPIREFLLLELTEQEFLYFKLMFDAIDIPQKYHEIQTEFLFWWMGYDFIENENEADAIYDQCCEDFYAHLEVVNRLLVGGHKLSGEGKNIDNYDLIDITQTSQEQLKIVQN